MASRSRSAKKRDRSSSPREQGEGDKRARRAASSAKGKGKERAASESSNEEGDGAVDKTPARATRRSKVKASAKPRFVGTVKLTFLAFKATRFARNLQALPEYITKERKTETSIRTFVKEFEGTHTPPEGTTWEYLVHPLGYGQEAVALDEDKLDVEVGSASGLWLQADEDADPVPKKPAYDGFIYVYTNTTYDRSRELFADWCSRGLQEFAKGVDHEGDPASDNGGPSS
ncbi:hypothetical protein Rhopal_003330-T1 [Rhodotorula paludigena]|uniref:Uncharacterized protein n=1 Tax=Rhodotorula paludigena TaxID=86838 RepID=A0AAV5GCV7_9BASI|nr:hypothetical protein Rhopal_003330-T1 [Rhodotorula paludigena]